MNEGDFDDNRIYFKVFKEKRTSRTYIYNLRHHVGDDKTLEFILKDLKKKLATSCLKKETGKAEYYGFQGNNHADKIKKYLLEKKIVTEDVFKDI